MKVQTVIKAIKVLAVILLSPFLLFIPFCFFGVILFLGVLWWNSSMVFSTHKFDPEKWHAPQTNASESTCYRGGMAMDIRNRLLKTGETRKSVEQLLGKPDPDSTGKNEYRYTLGMCSGIRFDYDDLHIYFDDQGRITHAEIIQH